MSRGLSRLKRTFLEGAGDNWTERLHLLSWTRLACLTLLATYFYVFMEWLFLVTKPSFMSPLSWVESLLVLVVSPGPMLVLLICPLTLFWLLGSLLPFPRYRSLGLVAGCLIPAALLGGCFLLLLDNFTLTVLGWGIRHSEGVWLTGYQIVLLGLTLLAYDQLWQTQRAVQSYRLERSLRVICGLLLALTLLGTVYSWSNHSGDSDVAANRSGQGQFPNILLVIGDGLASTHMSLYGYQRDTTPGLRELADRALVAENCFPNAGPSGASIASILTGKLPTETRLVYPPDILTGLDSYQHLPALLRMRGYRSANISLRHYVDAYDLNMRNSFDWSNGRQIEDSVLPEFLVSLTGQKSDYFLSSLRDRIESRLWHIFKVQRMSDAFEEVVQTEKQYTRDGERTHQLWQFIDQGPGPFFAYLHLLGTHGDHFNPPNRIFSEGQTQTEPWMTDFYDDAVLAFDQQVQQLWLGLQNRGLLSNTIVIIGSDHGMKHAIGERVPLMFLFPENEPSGHIGANVQNLDIAPTLLDYLGISQPVWMSGRSLLSGEPESRPLFSTDRAVLPATGEGGWRQFESANLRPPFFSLGYVSVAQCDTVYKLDLKNGWLFVSSVEKHTRPCPSDGRGTPQEATRLILDHLAENKYDVSALDPSAMRIFPAR